jgi:transcriptional regulator with XRE-family HTH domain
MPMVKKVRLPKPTNKITITNRFDQARFSALIREQCRRYTLEKMAEQVGLSAATLSRLENEKSPPNIETFFAVCAWLDVSPELFMRGMFMPTRCPECVKLQLILDDIRSLANSR